jgi:twinkle protein
MLVEAHKPCGDCGSSDALSVYEDHTFCFSCQKHRWVSDKPVITKEVTVSDLVPLGQYSDLPSRKIYAHTCKNFGYFVAKVNNEPCQVAPYYDKDGNLVAQKLRFAGKKFMTRGDFTGVGLFGQQLWGKGGKRLVIVEGELDALAYGEANPTWAVVSVPSGAASAKGAIERNIEFVEKFEEVVFMFDMDEPGQKAARECAEVVTPGKAFIARLPLKDAGDMVKEGRIQELVKSVYNAKPHRPDGVVNGKELWDHVNKPIVLGLPYPFAGFNRVLFGARPREVVTITAGSGVGKSTIAAQIAYNLAVVQGKTVGYVALEESVGRTGLRFMSLALGKPMHLPQEISEEDKKVAFDKTLGTGRLFLYDHFGSLDSDHLLAKLRYMVTACGCEFLFLDHLSILMSGSDFMVAGGDERKQIDYTMTKLRQFTEQTGAGLFLISHLRRSSQGDKGFEDGLEPSLSSLRGSQSIAQLSDAVIAVSRKASEGDNVLRVRCLKNRYAGLTGEVCDLNYDTKTGQLTEATEFEGDDIAI